MGNRAKQQGFHIIIIREIDIISVIRGQKTFHASKLANLLELKRV